MDETNPGEQEKHSGAKMGAPDDAFFDHRSLSKFCRIISVIIIL